MLRYQDRQFFSKSDSSPPMTRRKSAMSLPNFAHDVVIDLPHLVQVADAEEPVVGVPVQDVGKGEGADQADTRGLPLLRQL